ncbi:MULTISPECIES: hypothetical protein [Vibrio]|uniref:hypothetical protein n=1 Tax=Vibrio TaxID=662 RepID=UPI001E48BA8A|nr:hypothetical protein [Vibrio sp. F13]MCC4888040.1 hypothetical protein [Vibrio sp. F13]
MLDKLIVVVLGGLVGFSLTLVKESLAARKSKAAETHYLAIIVTSSLERFIIGCREVVTDEGYEDQQGLMRSNSLIPTFEPLELEVDWKILPQDLLYSLLSLPQLINEANVYISATSEYVATPPDYEEYFEARKTKYASLGMLAIQMSEQLRLLGNLPKRRIEEWGDKQAFLLALKEIGEREVERLESRKRMFDSLKAQEYGK